MNQIVVLSMILLTSSALSRDVMAILLPRDASPNVILAGKEIRRYVYLRTGVLCDILNEGRTLPKKQFMVALAPRSSGLLGKLPLDPSFRDSLGRLTEDEYVLKTIPTASGKTLLISGYDDVSVLYGAYTFAEKLGIRFYAHGDVIPDGTIPLEFPDLDELHAPLFATRGLQPFHDFPEGPDWWDLDDYRALFSQMVKLRMNFFGLHTYPEGNAGPEPTVWIGLKEDIRADGKVAEGYLSRYFTTTGDPSWGYNPRKTGDYLYGLGDLFESDEFGSEVMQGYSPHIRIGSSMPIPEEFLWKLEPRAISAEQWSELFTRTARLLSSAFSFGRTLGIKMCIGTETPLTIPTPVKERIRALGKDTAESRIHQEFYEGIFERIRQTVPLDYYWFWTPEDWTWSGNNQEQVERTRRDLEAAQRALESVRAPFTLATCGWVLGPKDDRSMFDMFLPKSWAISCISREVGYETIEPGFARISGRPKWAIPWLEDDPSITIPQFWAGRMRRDAADALAYGCTGLIGIHWRTMVLSPNISSLARAAWDQRGWNPRFGEKLAPEQALARSKQPERCLLSNDFYLDWAESQFGGTIAVRAAEIFSRLDGLEKCDRGRLSATNMPVPADWVGGPGGVKVDSLTWQDRKGDYKFVDEFESLRPEITGAGNLERYDYWLNTFKYLRAVGKFASSAGEINRLIELGKKDSAADRSRYRQSFVDLRTRQMRELEDVFAYLLLTVSTKGEMGTVANWQQHNVTFFVIMPGREIEKLLGQELPESCWPSRNLLVQERIIVPTVRTALRKGEDLSIKAILPAGTIQSARLHWRPLGGKVFAERTMTHINRAVWGTTVPGREITDDIEYYIEVKTPTRSLCHPAGAPGRNQTVVVY